MKIETPFLKRTGPIPFWRGERRCVDTLEEIYRRAADRVAATAAAESAGKRKKA